MPSWVLRCKGCKKEFRHSMIEDTEISSYFLPNKPEFPVGGSEMECPNCGEKSMFQRTDLLYRS